MPVIILKSGKNPGVLIFFSLRRHSVVAYCILPLKINESLGRSCYSYLFSNYASSEMIHLDGVNLG